MTREQELNDLIEAYGLNKAELDSYKALCDKENAEIKNIMAEADIQKFNSSTYTATYSIQHRTTMNEDKVIGIIRTHDLPDSLGIIKVLEYIDDDALESAIYKGLIPDAIVKEIGECMTVKEIPTLKLSKKKGE